MSSKPHHMENSSNSSYNIFWMAAYLYKLIMPLINMCKVFLGREFLERETCFYIETIC